MRRIHNSYADRKRRRRQSLTLKVAVALAVILLLTLLVPLFAGYHQTKQQDCTINGKDRTSSMTSNGASNVRIYTDDCGVFTIQDSLVHTRWNSADLYGQIKVGQRYHVAYYGWRIPFFSAFPNLLSADRIDE